MAGMPKRKDEDADPEEISPFADARKNVVLREARIFHEPQLSAGKCQQVLTRLLYLLNQGETLTNEEALDLFFASTKLFQAQDVHLRRLTYLLLKELRIDSDSSLIVVSCLSKDMTSKTDLFRANSIRVLAKIMDGTMVGQMDRFLKQSLVDKNPFIVSSVLVGGLELYQIPGAADFIKRWVNEVQEALTARSAMVQFHALALLHRIKSHDKLAISKIVSGLPRTASQTGVHSPLQYVLHIRIVNNLIQSSNPPNPELLKQLVDYLHNKSPMVSLEAARSIARLDHITAAQLIPAVSVLQEFLSSSVSTQRFAAVRTLSEIVGRFPLIVTPCVVDLEHLITDPNRSIATLAITTLLKTGVEANVDRLMKSISGFMTEIADEFKIVLVDAIRALCLKFPSKHVVLLNFLAQALREEGGFKYKKALVDAMLSIIGEVKEATEAGLEHFCEFIEDCEFPELAVTILHLLGDKGPTTPNPAKYIRFIFNRVILETASVRAAAVSALAKFGAAVPALRENVIVLLKRCLNDNDDEMRDRAIFYLAMLNNERAAAKILATPKPLPNLASLEYSLTQYLEKGANQPFSLSKHLVAAPEESEQKVEEKKEGGSGKEPSTPSAGASSKGAANIQVGAVTGPSNPYLDSLLAIPEIAALGSLFKSSAPVELTESETEYVVTCVKHIYPQHIVFQFNVTNNMEDQQLENVTVEMEAEEAGWTEELSIPETKLIYQVPGTTYVCFNRPNNSFTSGSLSCTLHFTVKEVDSGEVSEDGHSDEYQLEDIEVNEADFMKPGENIGLVEFRRQWETLGESAEVVKKYSLGLDSLQAAVTAVLDLLGMTACEGSATVPEGARTHAVNATGVFFGDVPVLARAAFILDPKLGVTLKIAVRSSNGQVNTMLTNAIR